MHHIIALFDGYTAISHTSICMYRVCVYIVCYVFVCIGTYKLCFHMLYSYMYVHNALVIRMNKIVDVMWERVLTSVCLPMLRPAINSVKYFRYIYNVVHVCERVPMSVTVCIIATCISSFYRLHRCRLLVFHFICILRRRRRLFVVKSKKRQIHWLKSNFSLDWSVLWCRSIVFILVTLHTLFCMLASVLFIQWIFF